MDTHFMQSLDYWIGRPLCFLVTFFHICLQRLKKIPTPDQEKANHILFIKLSEMGSVILALPSIEETKKAYPQAKLFFVTFLKNRPLLDIVAPIPLWHTYTIRTDSLFLFLKDTFYVITLLRREHIDIVFDLEFFSRFSTLLSYFSGAPQRIGFHRYNLEGFYRGELLTHKVPYMPHQHIAKSYFSMVMAFTQQIKKSPITTVIPALNLPDIASSLSDKNSVKEILHSHVPRFAETYRILLFFPGDGIHLPMREWPLSYFIELAKKILATQKDCYIFFIGPASSSQRADQACQTIAHEHCINLTNQFTLKQLIGLFEISDMLISNDSGIAHLASLTFISQIVLFGPESPDIFSPLATHKPSRLTILYTPFICSPCVSILNHRRTFCNDNRCLKSISIDKVYKILVLPPKQ